MNTVKQLVSKVNDDVLMTRSMNEWQNLLVDECQVYSCGAMYIAKRFDEINFSFCDKNTAKDILVDNLYVILTYKYFTTRSDEIDERIQRIVGSFTANLKRLLKSVTFDPAEAASAQKFLVSYLPDGCVAFANGVYDFKNDKWFFKYDITRISRICNSIYAYDTKYIIQWYLNYNFDPLPIAICDTNIEDFVEIFKAIDAEDKNFCFELAYNIAHDSKHEFDINRFKHFCEILGYCCLNSFSQFFVLLIGSGQNGKNSLFDGCFTNRVVPRPASISFDTIENDKFITGSLENHSHNIFLETSAKKYTESKMIKALTGSMYQSIENKNVQRYSGIVNCKHVFAGNDRDLIKFSDTTVGFLRRVNLFEIYYAWDKGKRFLKRGDYYDTTFSDSLSELKSDVRNTTVFVYLAMMGIASATNNFKTFFKFTSNEWSSNYADTDNDLGQSLNNLTYDDLFAYAMKSEDKTELVKQSVFTLDGTRMYLSAEMRKLGISSWEALLNDYDGSQECLQSFFAENDIYVSVRLLQQLVGNFDKSTTFTTNVKKLYNIAVFPFNYRNVPCVKVRVNGNSLRIINS